MKIAFWFVGASCSGKSKYAKIIADKLKTNWISLDTINDKMGLEGMTREEGYEFLFREKKDVIVVDGIIPLSFHTDMDLVKKNLVGYNIIIVLVEPYYEKWLENRKQRKIEIPDSDPIKLSERKYKKYNSYLREKFSRHLLIREEIELQVISEEQIRNLNYQHDGFTDVKFKQLNIECKDKSVLDLGCSSCQFEPLFMQKGASRYKGLDINFSYLIRKNAELFNINNLEHWKEEFDVVVCSSVMHYIHDKEKFVRECSRLTRELCVLEIPLDRGEGVELHLGSRGLYFPTKKLFEQWLAEYFKSFICLGESIVEDGSYRLIYHCKNI